MPPEAGVLAQHQPAVVILENYSEPQLGQPFHDRSVEWFVMLRSLNFQHIFFLQVATLLTRNS